MRHAICLLFAALSCVTIRAQTDVPYFETIEGDSVHLYLESAGLFGSAYTTFTGKDCARGYRATRINSVGKFDGPFADIMVTGRSAQHMLMAHGVYRNGKKEGAFVFYHHNGKVMLEGQYVQDEPAGEWRFSTEDEALVMTLQFDEKGEGRIQYMYDDKAKVVLVMDGNGEARFVTQGEPVYVVSGKVRSGLPEGEWIGEVTEWVGTEQTKWIRKETYKNGVMVAGKKYQSLRITDVCCTPELTGIFPPPVISDLVKLEAFPIQRCTYPNKVVIAPQDMPAPRSAVPVTDLYNFESSIKSIILSKYQGRQVGESIGTTTLGNEENQLIMHFNTDENGRPVKVRQVSAFGREFFQPIKRSLETLTKWQPNQNKLVLTVYIRMGVSTYGYRYNVSLD